MPFPSNRYLTARDLSYELPNGRLLFRNLTLSLGDRLTALVGPNGVGKTTLAKVLAGELAPTGGEVRRQGPLVFFAQREEPPPVSLEEFLGPEWAWTLQGERLLAGIDRTGSCTSLSGGQWMRARLARACAQEQSYLILDEPTNDLDRDGREAVLDFLRGHAGGALLISHDREALALCDEILELSNRGLSRHGGGWEVYRAARDQERENLTRSLAAAGKARDQALAERRKEREKQEKRNRRVADAAAKGGLPKILLGARKRAAQATTGKIDTGTLHKAAEAARSLQTALSELKVDPAMYAELEGRVLPAQKLVAEAAGFNLRYRGSGHWVYPGDLDFAWRGNVRLALRGANGSGKSTLLRALLGGLPSGVETRGGLRPGSLEILVLDQRLATLDDARTLFENVRDVSGASDTEIRNALARFLFPREAAFQKVGELSGGERLRAALARGFLGARRPELLLLDEPTNNLDAANIEFLEKVVARFRAAVLVISHDETFLANCRLEDELVLPRR
jgi:ATPase subunit of ABC transporter with duplicated ATPase domains